MDSECREHIPHTTASPPPAGLNTQAMLRLWIPGFGANFWPYRLLYVLHQKLLFIRRDYTRFNFSLSSLFFADMRGKWHAAVAHPPLVSKCFAFWEAFQLTTIWLYKVVIWDTVPFLSAQTSPATFINNRFLFIEPQQTECIFSSLLHHSYTNTGMKILGY